MNSLQSSGTVLVDQSGRILLRKPSGEYGGYSWTFTKGTVDAGETAEAAALRETYEESGYRCRIIKKLGEFSSGFSDTIFYLAQPLDFDEDLGWETEAVGWFTPEEARTAISTTPNFAGRRRDLAVLDAALRFLDECCGEVQSQHLPC